MKRTIIMGLGIAAIALAIWVPTLTGSGFGATAAGQAAAASDQAAGLETVGQGHPALLLIFVAITLLVFGLVSVIGAGRRRA